MSTRTIHMTTAHAPITGGRLWAGRILTGLLCALLAMGAVMALTNNPAAVKGTVEMGWPPSLIPVLGAVELILLALYLIPRTAILGAVLWTAYFGGAVATHLRLQQPLLTMTLMPVYMATLMWGALWLRNRKVGEFLFG